MLRRLALGIAATAGMTALLCAESDFSKPKETVIPLVGQAPAIDGKLDEEVWRQASRATNFLDLGRIKKTASEQTDVLMMRDKDNLYFGFICESHDPTRIKAATPKSERDFSRLYKDDSVNLFIDAEHSGNDCHQWIFNSNGAVFDQVCHRLIYTEVMLPSKEWNSHAEAAGGKGDRQWFIEVRIPLSDFTPRDLKALNEGKAWGIQFGRENWTLPNGGEERSTWSATYSFVEAESFGVAKFTGAPVVEKRQAWEQKADKSMAFMAPPSRPNYTFTKCFDFGPPPTQEEIAADYPKGVIFVSPASLFVQNNEFGFVSSDGLHAERKVQNTSHKMSPLAADYIESKAPAEFKFTLPAGDYKAVFFCGKFPLSSDSPAIDFGLDVNGAKTRVYNQEAGRVFLPVWASLKSDGKSPVTTRLVPNSGSSWAVAAAVICPEAEFAQAREAVYWLERDFYNHPFEKFVATADVWIDIPPANAAPCVFKEEREKGLAIFALSPTAIVSGSYAPEKSDPRDKSVTIVSPGSSLGLAFGVHAIRPLQNLNVKIERRPEGGARSPGLAGAMLADQYRQADHETDGMVPETPIGGGAYHLERQPNTGVFP